MGGGFPEGHHALLASQEGSETFLSLPAYPAGRRSGSRGLLPAIAAGRGRGRGKGAGLGGDHGPTSARPEKALYYPVWRSQLRPYMGRRKRLLRPLYVITSKFSAGCRADPVAGRLREPVLWAEPPFKGPAPRMNGAIQFCIFFGGTGNRFSGSNSS